MRAMATKDPRIDAYIAKSADFAKPILKKIRALVHAGCPDVVETIKWGSPHFEHHGMLCGMAAFKEHCALGFWNRALAIAKQGSAAGQFGTIRSLSDLPADKVIVGYVREAARLNETGQKVGPVRKAKKPLPVPRELAAALEKKPRAKSHFKAFSPSQKREYSEWILEAKTDATRQKRLETAVGWIGEGKTRMWKYRRPAAGAPRSGSRRATT
jgi:uncharacterized protein YdeI (YjbR/CyaY-like superfamily)